MRWTAKHNETIREEILDAVGKGNRTAPEIVAFLGAPEMTVRFYVKLLKEQDYLRAERKTLFLNEQDFEWCGGCGLIPGNKHPLEWCE